MLLTIALCVAVSFGSCGHFRRAETSATLPVMGHGTLDDRLEQGLAFATDDAV
jgi:hypothetical protein